MDTNSLQKLQVKVVTDTITRVFIPSSYWPFTDPDYSLPFTFVMPTDELEFCIKLAKLCKSSVNHSSKDRESLLYSVLGEIILMLWAQYSQNNPPSAVLFISDSDIRPFGSNTSLNFLSPGQLTQC